jgi:hypothetical protein
MNSGARCCFDKEIKTLRQDIEGRPVPIDSFKTLLGMLYETVLFIFHNQETAQLEVSFLRFLDDWIEFRFSSCTVEEEGNEVSEAQTDLISVAEYLILFNVFLLLSRKKSTTLRDSSSIRAFDPSRRT